MGSALSVATDSLEYLTSVCSYNRNCMVCLVVEPLTAGRQQNKCKQKDTDGIVGSRQVLSCLSMV